MSIQDRPAIGATQWKFIQRTSPPSEPAELELWDRVTVRSSSVAAKPIHVSQRYIAACNRSLSNQ